MRRLDAFLIERCEGLAHPIQRLTGWTNFRLSALLYSIYAGTLSIWFFAPPRYLPLAYFLTGLVTAMALGNWYILPIREYLALDRLNRGVANPKKMEHGYRLGMLAFTVALVIFMATIRQAYLYLYFTSQLAWVVSVYLEACDPLPPSESKVRQWINSFKKRTVLVPVENAA